MKLFKVTMQGKGDIHKVLAFVYAEQLELAISKAKLLYNQPILEVEDLSDKEGEGII